MTGINSNLLRRYLRYPIIYLNWEPTHNFSPSKMKGLRRHWKMANGVDRYVEVERGFAPTSDAGFDLLRVLEGEDKPMKQLKGIVTELLASNGTGSTFKNAIASANDMHRPELKAEALPEGCRNYFLKETVLLGSDELNESVPIKLQREVSKPDDPKTVVVRVVWTVWPKVAPFLALGYLFPDEQEEGSQLTGVKTPDSSTATKFSVVESEATSADRPQWKSKRRRSTTSDHEQDYCSSKQARTTSSILIDSLDLAPRNGSNLYPPSTQ